MGQLILVMNGIVSRGLTGIRNQKAMICNHLISLRPSLYAWIKKREIKRDIFWSESTFFSLCVGMNGCHLLWYNCHKLSLTGRLRASRFIRLLNCFAASSRWWPLILLALSLLGTGIFNPTPFYISCNLHKQPFYVNTTWLPNMPRTELH